VINVSRIPPDIRAERQWAVRRAKVPYIAGTGEKAKCNDPATWRGFDEAKAAVEAGKGDGLYYALRAGSGIVGIDLDHCVTDGAIDPWAMVYVRLLDSYTCLSASGTGLRILVKGAKTSDRCKRGPVECYDHDRFLSITDRRVPGTPDVIEDRQAELEAFMQLAFPDPKPEPGPKATASKPSSDLGADHLFAAAMRDAKFARLHSGDTAGYSSPSEARMGYLYKASFYARRDAALMDGWFRTSGLDQAKWERLGSSEIAKAVEGCSAIYDPDSGVDLANGLDDGRAAVEAAESIIAGGCCGGCTCGCKRARQLERTAAIAKQHVSAMTTIRKSTGLSGEFKNVAAALLTRVEDARRRGLSEVKIFYGDREARKAGKDPGGIARDAGTSPHTVGRFVEEIRHREASPYRFETVEDDAGRPRVVVRFDLDSTIATDAAAMAGLTREKAQHGGTRTACPDHPKAPLIRTLACSECGQIVAQDTLNVDPEAPSSKLLQGIAAATARQRDDKVRQFATRAVAKAPSGALLHDATGPRPPLLQPARPPSPTRADALTTAQLERQRQEREAAAAAAVYRPCAVTGCDTALRPGQALLCDRHRAKDKPPPDEQRDAVTIRTEKAWRDAGIDVAKLRAAQAAGVDISAAARATGIADDAAALAAAFPLPRTAELPFLPAHNDVGEARSL
jgi:putative DNA primase/helicase